MWIHKYKKGVEKVKLLHYYQPPQVLASAHIYQPILCSLPETQLLSPHPLSDICSHIFSTDTDSFQLLSLLLILCPVWTVIALIKLSSQLLMFQLMSLAARRPAIFPPDACWGVGCVASNPPISSDSAPVEHQLSASFSPD